MKNKKFILGFILGGLFFSTIGVLAASVVLSSNVLYHNANSKTSKENVRDALDELYDYSFNKKRSITTALNNKGLELDEDSSYENIIAGINSLPIGKTENGEWGYMEDEEIKPFGTLKKIATIDNPNVTSGGTLGSAYSTTIDVPEGTTLENIFPVVTKISAYSYSYGPNNARGVTKSALPTLSLDGTKLSITFPIVTVLPSTGGGYGQWCIQTCDIYIVK